MGPFSSGRSSRLLSWLVLGTTLAVQLHARGLRSVTQGTAALEAPPAFPPALPPAPVQQLWLNATAFSAPSVNAALLEELPPASGTTAPEVLAAIPLLLSPVRGMITPQQTGEARLESGPLQLTGRPGVVSAATAAKMEARRAALLQQWQQQQAVAGGFRVDAEPPPAYSAILAQHNSHRARHQAEPLTWDELLGDSAATYAAQCVFDHDAASISGESLYATSATADTAAALTSAIQLWYDEVQYYDFNDPGFSSATGHFTQVVWKNSRTMGCAVQVCPAGISHTPFSAGTLVVCRYTPPGNVLNRFEQNVLPVPQPPAPPASTPTGPGQEDAVLPEGHNFVSPGCLVAVGDVFWLCIQNDGNVVLFENKQPVWASNSAHKSAFRPFKLTMQRDGNLVASDKLDNNVWMTRTAGQGAAPYRLVVQGDGNVVIVDAASTPLWSTNTGVQAGVTP